MEKVIIEKKDGEMVEGFTDKAHVSKMGEGDSAIVYTNEEMTEMVEVYSEDVKDVAWEVANGDTKIEFEAGPVVNLTVAGDAKYGGHAEISEEGKEKLNEFMDENQLELPLTDFPTLEVLSEIYPDTGTAVNRSELERGHHCTKWGAENGYHFLGFHISDGEPIFKEIK